MADYERHNDHRRGNFNHRKRRHRDFDDHDRHQQRRRYEEPVHIKVRKILLGLAESPVRRVEDEITDLTQLICEHAEDGHVTSTLQNVSSQMILEQPLRIPFVAALFLSINAQKPEVVDALLERIAAISQKALVEGEWRQVKLCLRLLAQLQPALSGDGILPLLEELFARAVDLQTTSSEDGLGLELVTIILLTIAYLMSSASQGLETKTSALLEKTDIIASTPHSLEPLVDPLARTEGQNEAGPPSTLALLQKALQAEANNGWTLRCLPRPWLTQSPRGTEYEGARHNLPAISIPSPAPAGSRLYLPSIYLSVYADQTATTVPNTADSACYLLRDAMVDAIHTLDFNRSAAAKFLIDADCFFAPDTFVKRATPFDKLRDLPADQPTWKPEDVAVDAVFSQLLQLPHPGHKLVYYHSVLTEACKIAPAAIAPSLGRAIRFLYRSLSAMDLELNGRFTDWFAHHLSNFGFTWKWTEWIDDLQLPAADPKMTFIRGVLEKEVRLSVVQRIEGTVPEPYRTLLPRQKEEDEPPPFKYAGEDEPFAAQARQLLQLLRRRAPEEDIDAQLKVIEDSAAEAGVELPAISAADVYMTAICFAGSKSLSHFLSFVERCKDRLLAFSALPAAQRQLVTSVMAYWSERPGIGTSLIDKLLNYGIVTPVSVVEWALVEPSGGRESNLAHAWIFELVFQTVKKVTGRVRQVVRSRNQPGLPVDQVALLDEALTKERAACAELFNLIENAVQVIAQDSAGAMLGSGDEAQDQLQAELLRRCSLRWLRTFRRLAAIEAAWVQQELDSGARASQDVSANGNGLVP